MRAVGAVGAIWASTVLYRPIHRAIRRVSGPLQYSTGPAGHQGSGPATLKVVKKGHFNRGLLPLAGVGPQTVNSPSRGQTCPEGPKLSYRTGTR